MTKAAGQETLCIDVGATSIKACVVEMDATMTTRRARRRTPEGLAPSALVAMIAEITQLVGPVDRVALGFPGLVRHGRVLRAANLARVQGAGSPEHPGLASAWSGFDLEDALIGATGVAVKVANDADVAALGCSTGTGVELTVTLGTGVGTGLVVDGHLAPHLELSEIPLRNAGSLDELVGERARKHLEPAEWDQHVAAIVSLFDQIISFDRCYLTGGNARRLRRDTLGELLGRVTVVHQPVGITGGIRLFDEP